MFRHLLWSVATLLGTLGFTGLVQAAETPGVRDAAGMFSADARKQADAELDRIRQSTGWAVVIETVESHGKKAIDSLAQENARALRIRGVYVLLAQREHRISIQVHSSAASLFNASVRETLKEKITAAFKEKRFDQGLLDGVAYVAEVAAEKPAAAVASPAARPDAREPAAGNQSSRGSYFMTALMIGGAILLVLFIVRLLSGAGRPGMSGMGSPGGGFLSSLFGAMGGVFLGNWLYNTFGGGHAQASDPGHSTSDTSGNDHYESTSGDWGSGGGDGGGFDGGGFDGGGGGGDW